VVDKDVATTIPTKTDIDNAATVPNPDNGTPGGTGTAQTNVVVPTEPVVISDPTFIAAEVMPVYDGMSKFFGRNLKYPSSAKRMGISGTVYVTFVVGKDGKVRDVQVLRGISPDCDKEAVRVISMMPGWSPGFQNHQPVSVRMTLPIKFYLQE
jgi:protein TonB